MNRNLFFGIGIALVVGAVIFFRQSGPQTNRGNNPFSLKKEINVGTDICAEFPKEWVQSVINKTVVKIEKTNLMKGLDICKYYIDETDFVTLRLNDLNFEIQKKGQQELGRIISTNDKIVLDHFIATQGDNIINDIVLKINPKLFLSVDRSSVKAANETEIINFAGKVAERIKNGENQGLVSAPTIEPTKKIETNVVPLPQETDIINNFISFIDEGKASDAVMMMTSSIINDDGTKQAYGVQYAAMTSVKVKKIEESSKSDWTDSWHQYMLTLDVVMDPSSANGPIPYYGYENGENVRFLNLIKEGNLWKIEGLATGP
jgi:hypothetical protein